MEFIFPVVLGAVAVIAVIVLLRSVRIVPQQRMDGVERLG